MTVTVTVCFHFLRSVRGTRKLITLRPIPIILLLQSNYFQSEKMIVSTGFKRIAVLHAEMLLDENCVGGKGFSGVHS